MQNINIVEKEYPLSNLQRDVMFYLFLGDSAEF
jgi:hypothetical protein